MSDTVADISFVDPEVQKCPFASYAKVRSEHPVYIDPITGFYVLTGYENVRLATMDTANLSSRAGQISIREGSTVADQVRRIYETEGWMPVHSLVNNDPPDHSRFRPFVEKAFLPGRLRTINPKIERAVERLIDNFVKDGQVEFMRGFAMTLPLLTFGEEFGIPEKDQADFRRWSEALLAQMDPLLPPERELALTREVVAMQQYLMTRVEHYRAEPGATLLSDLVQAADDGKMNTAELLSVIQMFVPAGHETTANTLGSGMRRIAENPELQARLRANPDSIPTFVEEVLRLDAAVQGLFRRATRDIEIAGVKIPKDATVVLSWGAANRDPAKFPQPDKVDLERGNSRQHLTFGVGTHFCVGSQLARAQLNIAFRQLLNRLSDVELDVGGAKYNAHFFAYGPAELHLKFTSPEAAAA